MSAVPKIDWDAAARHLALLTGGDGQRTPVIFQTFDDNDKRKDSQLTAVIHAPLVQARPQLEALSRRGAGIFITVNQMRGAKRAKDECVAARAVWIDEDDGPGETPPISPQLIIETSPGRRHAYFFSNTTDLDAWDRVQKGMHRYGCDPKAVDRARVLRLAGTWNQKPKYGAPFQARIAEVNVEKARYTWDEILAALDQPKAATPKTAERPAQKSETAPEGEPVHEGGRNDFLFRAASGMRHWGLSAGGITNALHQLNLDRCVPPLEDAEVETIARSASKYTPEPFEEQRSADSVALRFEPDHVTLNRPPLRWWVPGVLPQAELILVYGASGSAKSFWVYDLLAAIARGEPWRGIKTRKGRVARIIAEGGSGDVLRKKAHLVEHGGELPGFIELYGSPDLADDWEQIAKGITAAGGADIVLIDTLSATTPGSDENLAADMKAVMARCRWISELTGATVILIHHAGKDPSKGARGSSAIKAAVDLEIEITPLDNGVRVATVTKSKDGQSGAQYPFRLRVVPLGVDEDDNPITSCVVEHIDLQKPAVTVYQPKGEVQRLVWRLVKDLDDSEIPIEEVRRQVISRMAPPEAGKRDTRAQRVTRAIDDLANQGFIELEDGIIRCP